MHSLSMRNFGPIEDCSIQVGDFEVFTGAQASGKSTIAKAIFFFRTIKDDILDVMMKREFSGNSFTLNNIVNRQLRNKFMQLFGSSRAMSRDAMLRYNYDSSTFINITLRMRETADYYSPNYIYIKYSQNIENFFKAYNKSVITTPEDKKYIINELKKLFCDEEETIFIPAGRSLITLLTTQLNYIFTAMSEEQKKTIDFCTQKYIERILQIRGLFADGIEGYLETQKSSSLTPLDTGVSRDAIRIIEKVLKGKYVFAENEERLILESGRFVKINYSSSGQQETVWIFNILMYQLINKIKTFVILEEPEAHLYPDAQKEITELLALFKNAGNTVLITTHSPYVLGTINNLLYARSIRNRDNNSEVDSVIAYNRQLSPCSSYYVSKGKIIDCLDKELKIISNEVIDGASDEINDTFDRLMGIKGGEV